MPDRSHRTSASADRLSVLVLPRHGRKGAASRLRLLDLLPGLTDHGIDVTVRPLFDDRHLDARDSGRAAPLAVGVGRGLRRLATLLRARSYDVVWIEKEALPFVPFAVESAMLAGSRFIVDHGDARFLHYQNHPRHLVRWLLGGKLSGLVRRARVTTVGNAPLESWACAAGAVEVVQLPTAIDLSRYAARPHTGAGVFTIGWIGSPSTAVYLHPIAPVLADLTSSGAARLLVVGAGDMALPGVTATYLPWDEHTEADLVAQFDVGIVPLEDGPWEQAKSPYKLLQYMASGLPVVGSPVGAVPDIIRHGVNGFLASTNDEWRLALDALRADPDLRRRMGDDARRSIASYSLDAVVPRLADLFWRVARQ